MPTIIMALIQNVFLEHPTCTVLHGVTSHETLSMLVRSYPETTILVQAHTWTSH